MEGSNLRELVHEELVLKTGQAAGIGLAAGGVYGAVASMLRDVPQVGSNVKYPQLVTTAKASGHCAGYLAALGATYVGVEQSLEKYRMKKDFLNGAVAGFAAGATVMGFRARSFRTAMVSGSALTLTSVLLDVTGMRTTEEEKKTHH